MTRKCLIEKSKKKPKYSTRKVYRCIGLISKCGRSRGTLNFYNVAICRMHFREYVYKGLLPGFKKKSW